MILRTKRLEARYLTEDDELDMRKLLSDGKVMEFSFASPMGQVDSKNYLLSAIGSYEKHGYGIYALSIPNEASFIGYCGFTYYDDLDSNSEIELGYRLLPEYWGKGIATEAAGAILDFGKSEFGFSRVISLIRKGNAASVKVATKLGATFEKELSINAHTALVYVYGENK